MDPHRPRLPISAIPPVHQEEYSRAQSIRLDTSYSERLEVITVHSAIRLGRYGYDQERCDHSTLDTT